MNEWIIYHNPRCGKSRAALELLEEHGIDPKIIRYLDAPPTLEEISNIAKILKCHPNQFVRKKEQVARSLGIDWNDSNQVLKAMSEHPVLIERPIVLFGNRGVVARPVELLSKFLIETEHR